MLPVFLAPGPTLRGLVTLDETANDLSGTGRDGDKVKPLMVLRDLPSLFEEDETTDAHVVAYVTLKDGEPVERQPRLNKEILGSLRAAGYEVMCFTVWIDLDLKDIFKKTEKVKWVDLNEAQTSQVWTLIEEAHVRLTAKEMPWTASYTTSGGMRFVHALALPVHAGEPYEALLRRFHIAYGLAGLPVDEACSDWTRLYRAPRVRRDDHDTAIQPWFSCRTDFDDDTTFYVPRDSDLLPAKEVHAVTPVRTDRDRPDPEQARALVEILNPANNRWQYTALGKRAKEALKDTPSYDVIFNRLPIAREGRRHDTLTRIVGEVVGLLHGIEDISPELVYGLLYDAAGRLGEDEDWPGKVWEMACTFWDKESTRKAQKAVEIAEKVKEQEQVKETERQRFLRGVRDWLPAIQGMDDEEAIEFVKANRYGIAMDAVRDRFHILLPTGYYDDHVCSSTALSKLIEQRGMQWLVPTEEARDDGRGNISYVPVRVERLVQQHARVYTASEIKLDKRASYMHTDFHGRDIYVDVPFALREDVSPELIQPIYEMWLAAAGGDKFRRDEMLAALGSLLLFQYGPTAAVLLWGEASAGKSVTATGLAECLTTRRLADGASLVDNFNDSLRQSPIIHIEEAADRGSKGIDGAAALRRIITASHISIEQKGKDKVWMQGVHRVLMTANSKDIVQRLMGATARTSADWRAIGERLAEFRIDDQATKWFEENNRGWVETRRWIGTHGRTGLYAKFWFWVIKNLLDWEGGRPKMRGRRLLYEGNCASSTIQRLEANAGAVPDVLHAINRLLSDSPRGKIALRDGKVWFTTRTVLAEAVEEGRARYSEARDALESLLDSKQPEDRETIHGVQARWKCIDAARLAGMIEQHLIPNPLLTPFLPAR